MTEKEKNQESDRTGDQPGAGVGDQLSDDQLGAVAGGTTRMEPLPLDPTVTRSVTKLKTVVDGTAELDGSSSTYANETFGVDYTGSNG
jgi:hypothetical protein